MANDDLASQAWLARFRATPFYESSGEESSLPDEAADRIEAQAAEIERLRNVIRQAIVDGDVKASPLPPTGVFQTPEEYWYRQGKDDQYETNADRITTLEAENAKLRADNAALVALIIELADDLEIEVRDRWGDDERLEHKLKRDMDVINRARALIAPHGDKTND